jgi:hypothetical protein
MVTPDVIFGGEIPSLYRRAGDASSFTERFHLIEPFLLDRLNRRPLLLAMA